MACITDHYTTIIVAFAGKVRDAVDWLTPSLGQPFAIVVIAAAMVIPSWIMFQAGRLWVPDFVVWWYDETITQRAREYVRRRCPGIGMTVKGAKISFFLGFMFIFLSQFIFSFPLFFIYTLPVLFLSFAGVAVVGCWVQGNVPSNEAARYRYFRRFQAPSLTGMGIGFATAFFQFLLEAGTLSARYLQII